MSDRRSPSRRDFLKGSTAAAAGIALAGGLSIARIGPCRRQRRAQGRL